MLGSAILRPTGITQRDGWTQLGWELTWGKSESFLLSHAVRDEDAHLLGEPDRGDHAIAAVLLWAMRQNLDLVVEGKVSPRLLDGLEELQAIWHCWRSERYNKILIKGEEELEIKSAKDDRLAIFAFSGGVDATFSLFRHLKQNAGRQIKKPGAALFIQGMDIPLNRDDFYQNAAERAKCILSDTGVPLIRMQTNSRQLVQNWEDSHGLQLSSCFLVFQQSFSAVVLGSSHTYDALLMPWGSSPLTDYLCSTAAMQIVHDGCGFDRTEKVEWLSKNTSICDYLRVCWAGPDLGKNCGKCTKCIQTMLNFWVVGQEIPDAFPTELTPDLIKSLRPKNQFQSTGVKNLYRHACLHYAEKDKRLKAIKFVMKKCFLNKYLEEFTSRLPRFLQKKIKKIKKVR